MSRIFEAPGGSHWRRFASRPTAGTGRETPRHFAISMKEMGFSKACRSQPGPAWHGVIGPVGLVQQVSRRPNMRNQALIPSFQRPPSKVVIRRVASYEQELLQVMRESLAAFDLRVK